jgi:hypothetical protein
MVRLQSQTRAFKKWIWELTSLYLEEFFGKAQLARREG